MNYGENSSGPLLEEVETLRHQIRELKSAEIRHSEVERTLRRERDFSNLLIEGCPAFFVAISAHGQTLAMNEAMLSATGYARDVAVGSDYVSVFVPRSDRKKLSEVFSRLMHHKSPTVNENRVLTRDGRELTVEWHGRSMFNKDGRVDFIFGVGIDITEQRRMENAVRRVNRALRAISRCNEALVRARVESAFISEVCRIIVDEGGYHAAWVGYVDTSHKRGIHPIAWSGCDKPFLNSIGLEGADFHSYSIPTMVAARTNRPYIQTNIHDSPEHADWLAHAKEWGYNSSLAIPLTVGRKVVAVLHIYSKSPDAFDTQELKLLQQLGDDLAFGISTLRTRAARKKAEESLRQTEQRYRNLFDNASDAIFIHDLQGRLLEVNRVACERLGYTHDELGSMTVVDIYTHECLAMMSRCLTRLTEGEHILIEMTLMCRNGKTVPVEANSRFVDYRGNPALLSIARDITERRQLEEQLRHAQRLEAVGRLAGGVAHDFNNYLTAIIGNCDAALATLGVDHRLRPYVDDAKKAGQQAASLCRQLLAFSRRQVLQPTNINLNSIVTNMETLMRRLIGENIRLVVNLDNNLHPVEADRSQIERVVMNLAVNARDAMPQGGTLSIETANVEIKQPATVGDSHLSSGHYAILKVKDGGAGMDEETLSHMFEPFFTTKCPEEGTGLGLSTVYGIVKQSGGQITVNSKPGHGTTFTIYLPRTDRPELPTSDNLHPHRRGTTPAP